MEPRVRPCLQTWRPGFLSRVLHALVFLRLSIPWSALRSDGLTALNCQWQERLRRNAEEDHKWLPLGCTDCDLLNQLPSCLLVSAFIATASQDFVLKRNGHPGKDGIIPTYDFWSTVMKLNRCAYIHCLHDVCRMHTCLRFHQSQIQNDVACPRPQAIALGTSDSGCPASSEAISNTARFSDQRRHA